VSSRRRLYLNLKAGIVSLFKTPAHYLKELTGKQSLFEKPYFDGDYRAMNLKFPVPTWGEPKPKSGGLWPPPGGSYWSRFIFGEGECGLSIFRGGECGELVNLHASIDQLTMGPYSLGTSYLWVATSSDQELAIVQPIEEHLFGASATIPIQLSEENSGTVTICVKAQIASGSFLKDIKFPIPLPWWDPKYDYRWQVFRYMLANVFPVAEHRLKDKLWDCGCVDIEVECDTCDDTGMAWDSETSAETVARSASCTVAITDSLGTGGPYAWGVTGTGFTLDNVETVGLTNTLNADGSACGAATITVNGCGDVEIESSVRCTSGHWVRDSFTCGPSGLWTSRSGPTSYVFYLIRGKEKSAQTIVGCFTDAELCVACEGFCSSNKPCIDYVCADIPPGTFADCGGSYETSLHDCTDGDDTRCFYGATPSYWLWECY